MKPVLLILLVGVFLAGRRCSCRSSLLTYPQRTIKKSPLLAALAALVLAGCGGPKNDSAAGRDPALEAKAAEIEAAFANAESTVDEARKTADESERVRESNGIIHVDAKQGFYSKIVSRSDSRFGENETSTETTEYSVNLPDGTALTAEIVRENGIVTKAQMNGRD